MQRLLSQDQVVLFSKTYCTYAKKAQALLVDLGARFRVIELDHEEKGVAIQWELSKVRTRAMPAY